MSKTGGGLFRAPNPPGSAYKILVSPSIVPNPSPSFSGSLLYICISSFREATEETGYDFQFISTPKPGCRTACIGFPQLYKSNCGCVFYAVAVSPVKKEAHIYRVKLKMRLDVVVYMAPGYCINSLIN